MRIHVCALVAELRSPQKKAPQPFGMRRSSRPEIGDRIAHSNQKIL
ncbi:hypothetical protein [Burkholderia dolosa]|nr:hypothetical protein [Burkholderia dolosa]MBR8056537.1 hypothetical protein [Burkholderia dolosa]MBR8459999.1 hypothetical protein [Burkholderia dolosa]MDN7422317.1 hypothetical protein [Burkholderia dolosa]